MSLRARDRVSGSERGAGWRRTEEGLVARAAGLELTLRGLLGAGSTDVARGQLLRGELGASLETLTQLCVAASVEEPDGSGRRGALQDALLSLQTVGQAAFEYELAVLPRRLTEVEASLARLRGQTTSNELLDHVCEELVVGGGFGRVVLSRVEGMLWKPWLASFGGADDTWFREWVDRPIVLDGDVIESRILAERRPALVQDTAAEEVYQPIIVDAGQSTSYVVAPLVVDEVVIGFLHADHSPSGRWVDGNDRDVLWAFAQGFAQMYERAVLRERLVEQRERVRRVLEASDDLLVERASVLVVPEAARPDGPEPLRAVPHFGPGEALEQLTEREREVLGLVAVGATNAQIADQLVVAESTVKTHVKHILRKLGVTNRAQAISEFLRT